MFRSGLTFGISLFLLVDMVLIHQLTRIHGVLFSDFFEYGVLIASGIAVSRQLVDRKWLLDKGAFATGTGSGVGLTLFLDSFVVDYWLGLHPVGYSVNVVQILSGMGFAIFLVGIMAHLILKSDTAL